MLDAATAARRCCERHPPGPGEDEWVPVPPAASDALTALVAAGGVLVLSGAGLSTESGIPDYRGPSGLARKHTPMTFQTFIGSPEARQRYWARSYLGWQQIGAAQPNDGHRAVAALQAAGHLSGIITQ